MQSKLFDLSGRVALAELSHLEGFPSAKPLRFSEGTP